MIDWSNAAFFFEKDIITREAILEIFMRRKIYFCSSCDGVRLEWKEEKKLSTFHFIISDTSCCSDNIFKYCNPFMRKMRKCVYFTYIGFHLSCCQTLIKIYLVFFLSFNSRQIDTYPGRPCHLTELGGKKTYF